MNKCWPSTNLVEERVGYFYVKDSSDWRFVLSDIKDEANQPLDFTGAELKIQFRTFNLPGLVIADLDQTSGIAVSGSDLTITSLASNRFWTARETIEVFGDLMMYRGSGLQRSSTHVIRLYLIVDPGTTRYE